MNSHLCCAQVRSLARMLIPASCSSLQCPSPSPTSHTDAPQGPLLDSLSPHAPSHSPTLHSPPASLLSLPHLPFSGSHLVFVIRAHTSVTACLHYTSRHPGLLTSVPMTVSYSGKLCNYLLPLALNSYLFFFITTR